MARTWLSIRVELVGGRGIDFWPRPGHIFAAACSHSFGQLAEVIDVGVPRWDPVHMHMFRLVTGAELTALDVWEALKPRGQPRQSHDQAETARLG